MLRFAIAISGENSSNESNADTRIVWWWLDHILPIISLRLPAEPNHKIATRDDETFYRPRGNNSNFTVDDGKSFIKRGDPRCLTRIFAVINNMQIQYLLKKTPQKKSRTEQNESQRDNLSIKIYTAAEQREKTRSECRGKDTNTRR